MQFFNVLLAVMASITTISASPKSLDVAKGREATSITSPTITPIVESQPSITSTSIQKLPQPPCEDRYMYRGRRICPGREFMSSRTRARHSRGIKTGTPGLDAPRKNPFWLPGDMPHGHGPVVLLTGTPRQMSAPTVESQHEPTTTT